MSKTGFKKRTENCYGYQVIFINLQHFVEEMPRKIRFDFPLFCDLSRLYPKHTNYEANE